MELQSRLDAAAAGDERPLSGPSACPSMPESSGSSGFATPQGSPLSASPSPIAQLCLPCDAHVAYSAAAAQSELSSTPATSASASSLSSSVESSAPASDSEEAAGGVAVWTRAQVKEEAARRDRCLLIIGEFVYDVSGFLRMHPGGKEILQENIGSDATNAFNSTHSARARRMMERYCVGRLASRRAAAGSSNIIKKPVELLEAVRNALQKQ
jgi:cytochrome b involved in lipid metabolism